MKGKRLIVISHTAHFLHDGAYYGWGPTINEIDKVAEKFEMVIHFAPLHTGLMRGGSLPYTQPNIKYIPLHRAGGENFIEKFRLLIFSPLNVMIILKELKKSDWIQLRAPSNIALVMLPVLSLFRHFHKWVKYAGNWNEKSPAITYRIQRWWLRKNILGSYVTVNGKWENEGKHILAFENPCISQEELLLAKDVVINKSYGNPLNICFVGQLDDNKGIVNLFESLQLLNEEQLSKVNKIFIVGDGPLMNILSDKKKEIKVDIELLGYLKHTEIDEIYRISHINILPSKSEGFPKVIAEGAAYGCIPIVTDVSSLGQYIDNTRGILLPDNSPENVFGAIKQILDLSEVERKNLGSNVASIADKFTYEHYIKRIFTEILYK